MHKHSQTYNTEAHNSCYDKQAKHYDSIIRIHILRSDSLDACTCGGLYCSAEPLPMGFTLPHTRLAFKRLGPLSCQRLGPPATLTTWVRFLYLRLTDPFRVSGCDPYLNPYLSIYTTRHHEASPRDSWNYAYHTKFIFHTITTTFILNIQFSCKFSTNQPNKIHVLFMPTYQLLVHKIQTTTYIYIYIYIFTCFRF